MVVVQLSCESGCYICLVDENLAEALGSDDDLARSICVALQEMGHEARSSSNTVEGTPLTLTLDATGLLTVMTPEEPEQLLAKCVLEETIDTTIDLVSPDVSVVTPSAAVFDELRSPPKKKPKGVVSVPPSATSVWVEVQNCPEDTIKEHFLRFVNKSLKSLCQTDGTAILCQDITPHTMRVKFSDTNVCFQFDSPEIAAEFLSLVQQCFISYEDCVLAAKVVQQEPRSTKTVLFKGLAADFIPAHFVRFLLKESKKMMDKEVKVQKCSEYQHDRQGAEVTFHCVDDAQGMCEALRVWFVEYEGERLVCDEVFADVVCDEVFADEEVSSSG